MEPKEMIVWMTQTSTKGRSTTAIKQVSGPVYVEFNGNKLAKTKWLIEGRVSADFDANGNLIGVEVVG